MNVVRKVRLRYRLNENSIQLETRYRGEKLTAEWLATMKTRLTIVVGGTSPDLCDGKLSLRNGRLCDRTYRSRQDICWGHRRVLQLGREQTRLENVLDSWRILKIAVRLLERWYRMVSPEGSAHLRKNCMCQISQLWLEISQ